MSNDYRAMWEELGIHMPMHDQVPLLEGDYSEEQAGPLKTRIEAFIETL